jgi:hypothetical protein
MHKTLIGSLALEREREEREGGMEGGKEGDFCFVR